MYIESDSADFSNVGLGKVVTEVDANVDALLSVYAGLGKKYKFKFQSFIDSIGGLSGSIWNGIDFLFVPYFAATVDEAYINVKTGVIKQPGISSHMAGCSPIRGTGATYNQVDYNNTLNFTDLGVANQSRFFGVAEKIKNILIDTDQIVLYAGGGALGCLQKLQGSNAVSLVKGVNIANAGRDLPIGPKILQGNHAFLTGLANDVTYTRDSFVEVMDGQLADVSPLPSGTILASDLPWYGNDTYNFRNLNVPDNDSVYAMMAIGKGLSKNDLITLNSAMYKFVKGI